MELYYAIISIFLLAIFPKQLTDVICFGRHRNEVFIKSKKTYYFIFAFWMSVFGILCLMMGSAAGVNHTFDDILDFCELNFGERDYARVDIIYDEKDYKYQGDFTMVYHIGLKQDNLDELIERIVKENRFIYEDYQLSEMEVVHGSGNYYFIFVEDEIFAKVKVGRKGLLRTVSYQWDREKLEQNIGE